MAKPTDGWWPTRRGQFTPPPERVRLPGTVEVTVTKSVCALALFWRRRDDDALGVFASLAELKRPVTVAHAAAAVALLHEIGVPGALRLAKRIDALCYEDPMNMTWGFDEMPSSMHRRERPMKQCAYIIEPHSGAKCRNRGDFNVDGARGAFCHLHARRMAIRVRSPARVQRRLAYQKKKNAGTPTSST